MQTTVRKLLHIHLQWTQLLSGKREGILSDTRQQLKYIRSNWWIKLRKFLHYIKGNIYLEKDYTVLHAKEQDTALMDHFIENAEWMPKQLQQINEGLIRESLLFWLIVG